MAEASIDDTTNCQVCFENYTEDGGHIPRILPCFHTICEKCVKELIKQTFPVKHVKVDCPECRTKHLAGNGYLTFPQNKYILSSLKRTKLKPKEEFCDEHDRAVVFYCKDVDCKKPICSICSLEEEHKSHELEDFKNFYDEKQKTCLASAITLKSELESKCEDLMVSKEVLNKETEKCVEKIAEEKTKYMKVFDDLRQDALYQKAAIEKNIENVSGNLMKTIQILEKEIVSIPTKKLDAVENCTSEVDVLKAVSESQLSTMRTRSFPEFIGETAVEEKCGEVYYSEIEPKLETREHNRDEITFEHTFMDIRKLDETYVSSPSFKVRDLSWVMIINRKDNFLGFHVKLASSFKSVSCKASVTMRLLAYERKKLPYTQDFQKTYGANSNWGMPQFYEWKRLTDPKNSFYNEKDDSITLQVHLVAKEPRYT